MDWITHWYFNIPIGLSCLLVFREDVKYRSIRIIWPFIIILIAILGWWSVDFRAFQETVFVNFLYITIVIGSSLLFLKSRGLSLQEILKRKICWGDILISFTLPFLFSIQSLVFFFPIVCAISITTQYMSEPGKSIPFAGIICMCVFLWKLIELRIYFDNDWITYF